MNNKTAGLKFVSNANVREVDQEYYIYAALDAINNPMAPLLGIPNLIYRGVTADGYCILGMTYLGESLDEMHKKEPFTELTLLLILQKMLRILKNIHGCGVLHNDVKPANILLFASELVLIGK